MPRTTKDQNIIITRLMRAHVNALASVLGKGAYGYSHAEKDAMASDLVTASEWLSARKLAAASHKVAASQPALVDAPAAPKGTPKGTWATRRERVGLRRQGTAARLAASPEASPIGRIPAGPGKQAPVKVEASPIIADCRISPDNITRRASKRALESLGDIDGIYIVTCDAHTVTFAGSPKVVRSIEARIATIKA